MEPSKGTIRRSEETRLKSTSIETALYDLIGAVQEVLPREEEKMVTFVVCTLLNRGAAIHAFRLEGILSSKFPGETQQGGKIRLLGE